MHDDSPTTTQRGYGWRHQERRARLLAEFEDGDPCARCGKPMREDDTIELDHTDDRTGYLGLSHQACNRRANSSCFSATNNPALRRKQVHMCPICGNPRPRRSATCSRECGWVWRRRRHQAGGGTVTEIATGS